MEFDRLSAERQKGMHADHSARGLLRSGATVKESIRLTEEQASAFVIKAVNEVANVAQDMDAFAQIVATLTARFRGREAELAQAVQFATSGSSTRFASVQREGERLFTEMRNRVFRELEIHRFSFVRPTKGDQAAMLSRLNLTPVKVEQPSKRKNAGGIPLAKHWDAMWADIAVKLWLGDLNPKSQADIKVAMFAWFTENEIVIGDTAVTQRARQIWQKIEDHKLGEVT